MSKRASNSKFRKVVTIASPQQSVTKSLNLPDDDSFETISEISNASDHETKLAFLQNEPSHKRMAKYQLTTASPISFTSNQKKRKFVFPENDNESENSIKPIKTEPSVFYGYDFHEEFLANPVRATTNPGDSSPNFKFFRMLPEDHASSHQRNAYKPKVTFDMGKENISTLPQPRESRGDEAIDINEKGNDDDDDQGHKTEGDEKQEAILEKLRKAMGGGGDKVGWDVFVKNARTKARISSAFLHAADDAMFDATGKELDIINDKTYILDQKRHSRRSIRKKGDEAPKLRKILEKHRIISKKNLEKKALNRVLNNLVRRKSKINYMREWMHSFKRDIHYKLLLLSFFRKAIVIHPKGKFRLTWDVISLLLIVYDLFYVPYQLGFGINAEGVLYYFDVVKDLFFFVDLFITFVTAYYDKNGTLVNKPRAIIRNYIKSSWFIPDFLTSLPIALIVDMALNDDNDSDNYNIVRLLRIVRFVRLIRVLKAMKLMRIFNKVEELLYSMIYRSIKGIFSILFYILLFAHWAACLFHFVGTIDLEELGDSWLSRYSIDTQSLYDRYVASMYWSIATMITVGFGDIVPSSTAERLVAIVAMLSGCAMFAYSMNTIGILVQNLNAKASKTKQLYFNVNKYMQEKNVSKQFRNKVLQYLDYTTESQSQTRDVEDEIFTSLSVNLQNELKKDINGQVLRDNLLFQSTFGSTFRSALSYYLEDQTFSPGEVIFTEDDKNHSLYFLETGVIEIFVNRCNVSISKIERGSHFGEYSFFTGKERNAGARSHNFTHVFQLKKDIFISMIEDFPFEKETFHMIKDKLNILENYENLKMKCFICEQDGHYARFCFRVHHVPDPKKAISDYRNANLTFMETFERNKSRKKFNSLKGKKLVALRLRDLARDAPPDVRKYLQQSEFAKSISMMGKSPMNNTLALPQVNMNRRRSRTIGFNELPMNFANPLEDMVPNENPQERKKFVSNQKNRMILNLIKQNTLAPINLNPMKTMKGGKTMKTLKTLKTLKTMKTMKQEEEGKDNSKSSSSSKSSGSKKSKSRSSSNSSSSSSNSSSSSGKKVIPSPRTAINMRKKRQSIGKLYLETPGGEPGVTFELIAVDGEGVKLEPADDSHLGNEIILPLLRYDDVIMDMVMTYQVYFPHNNVKKVLEAIVQAEKAKKKLAKIGVETPKKNLSDLFARSNTESISKKMAKSPSRTKESRVKSVFVAPRQSVWNMARSKTKKSTGNNISPLGMVAMKNQALAGLIPHVIAAGAPIPQKKRRLSRSLGVLEAVPVSADSDRGEDTIQSRQSHQSSYYSHNVEASVEQSGEQSVEHSVEKDSQAAEENIEEADVNENINIWSRTLRFDRPKKDELEIERKAEPLLDPRRGRLKEQKVMRRGVSNFQ